MGSRKKGSQQGQMLNVNVNVVAAPGEDEGRRPKAGNAVAGCSQPSKSQTRKKVEFFWFLGAAVAVAALSTTNITKLARRKSDTWMGLHKINTNFKI